MSKNALNLVEGYLLVLSKIRSMAFDEYLYDIMVYGDSPGTEHYMHEMGLGANEQKIIMEITEDE